MRNRVPLADVLRAEFLGRIADNYKGAMAVAEYHGDDEGMDTLRSEQLHMIESLRNIPDDRLIELHLMWEAADPFNKGAGSVYWHDWRTIGVTNPQRN